MALVILTSLASSYDPVPGGKAIRGSLGNASCSTGPGFEPQALGDPLVIGFPVDPTVRLLVSNRHGAPSHACGCSRSSLSKAPTEDRLIEGDADKRVPAGKGHGLDVYRREGLVKVTNVRRGYGSYPPVVVTAGFLRARRRHET